MGLVPGYILVLSQNEKFTDDVPESQLSDNLAQNL